MGERQDLMRELRKIKVKKNMYNTVTICADIICVCVCECTLVLLYVFTVWAKHMGGKKIWPNWQPVSLGLV